MASLYSKIKESAQKSPRSIAVVFYGKRYNYAKILSLVDKAAAGLEGMGVRAGEVVTLCMPNSPSALVAFYALNRIGAVVNLVHPLSSAAAIERSYLASGSTRLICYDLFLAEKGADFSEQIQIIASRSDYFMGAIAKLVFRRKNRKLFKDAQQKNATIHAKTPIFEQFFRLRESVNPPAEDNGGAAVYLPSGGTSGSPKIIMHTAEVFNRLCSHAAFFLSEPLENYSAMYSVLPIFHGFGLCMNMHMCVTQGFKNVMSLKFSPESMLKSIKKEGVNIITGVPAMYQKLLLCPLIKKIDLRSVKDCFVGGDSVPKGLVGEFNAALKSGGSSAELYIGYGLTETVTVCTVTCKRHNREGSIGYPLPDVKIKIMPRTDEVAAENLSITGKLSSLKTAILNKKPKTEDELPELRAGEVGEICISTPLLMMGYLGSDFSPIKTISGQKWLVTGDLGFVDADGFLYFKQRIKNMIKVSGVPVFPSEIEDTVEQLEGVKRAAAIAVSDTKTGQAVKLFIESDTVVPDTLREKVIDMCKKNLNPYAVPKYIEIQPALPLNAIGKVDRQKLK